MRRLFRKEFRDLFHIRTIDVYNQVQEAIQTCASDALGVATSAIIHTFKLDPAPNKCTQVTATVTVNVHLKKVDLGSIQTTLMSMVQDGSFKQVLHTSINVIGR